MYKLIFKRLIDIIFTSIAFILFLPVFILVICFLFLYNNGSPFFFQKRPGKHNRVFRLIKFRSMNNKRDEHGKLLPDEQRITPIGRFIRFTSLDELPQLINVIMGDMSLVGPRPLLMKYLDRYTSEQARRHEVKPGITGWAQVNGRNAISWEKKFELDVYYVDHISFLLDLKILWMTLWKVIKRKGITGTQSATMKEFKGSKKQI